MNKYYNISKDWKNVNEMDANDFKNFICYSNDFLRKKKDEFIIFCKDLYFEQKYIDIYLKFNDNRIVHFKIDQNDRLTCAVEEDTVYEHFCDKYCFIFRK